MADSQKMEIEQSKSKEEPKPQVAQVVETYFLDEDDDDFEEFEIEGISFNLILLIYLWSILKYTLKSKLLFRW